MVKLPNILESFEQDLKDPKKIFYLNRIIWLGLFLIFCAVILALASFVYLDLILPFNLTLYALGFTFFGLGLTMILSVINITANRVYSDLINEEQKNLVRELGKQLLELNTKIDRLHEDLNKAKEWQEGI
ncbi:MAG: hypothetical protein QW491_13845 [Thermoproteota archaeon]